MNITEKYKNTRMIELMIALLAFTISQGVEALDSAPVGDWQLSATGVGSENVEVLQGSGNAVTVSFPEQRVSSPPSQSAITDLIIGGSNPDNTFTGNLLGRGYSGIRFRIAGDGTVPDSVSLIIYQIENSKIREWKYDNIVVSSTPGEWMITLSPLARDKGWTTEYESMKRSPDMLWETDLSAVQSMFIRIAPSGTAAQSYSFADVQLTGPGVISEPATLTPLEAYFGVSSADALTEEMRKIDSDDDGMSDYNEILAGLNPHDASSVLSARVAVATTGNTVSWEGVLGGSYGVMRSSNLLEGFQLIASGRRCSYTGEVMSYEDTAPMAGQPNFYKVVRY